MARELTKKALLTICSVLVFLGAAEALCRLRYSPEQAHSQSLFEYDKDKIYRLRAGFHGHFAGIDNVDINDFGFRGPAIALSKPAHTERIAVLGDSVSFGHGVPNDAPYPRILERLLSHSGIQSRFEVLNLGVPGYSGFQEYFDLERAFKYKPDLVILEFDLNDVIEPYQAYKRFGGAGEIPTMPDILDVPYYRYLLHQHSALYLFLSDMIARIRFSDPSGANIRENAKQREALSVENLVLHSDNPEISRAWHEYLGWLKRMTDLAKTEHVPFILLVAPYDVQLIPGSGLDSPQMILESFCANNHVYYLNPMDSLRRDLAAVLRTIEPGALFTDEMTLLSKTAEQDPEQVMRFWNILFLDEDHPNTLGHQYIAHELYPLVSTILSEQHGMTPGK